jgi:hypothetical protein
LAFPGPATRAPTRKGAAPWRLRRRSEVYRLPRRLWGLDDQAAMAA